MREYPSLTVIATTAGGGAGYQAFKTLADAITANDIAMTTPVLSDVRGAGGGAGGGAMRFVLPPGTAPPPPTPGVSVDTIPGGPYATASFTGFATDAAAARAEAALRRDVAAAGLKVAPDAKALLAVYNGPDTLLPPLRLNEVWLPLAEFDVWQ